MITLKIIGSLLLILLGVFALIYQIKKPSTFNDWDEELINDSVNFRGYIIAFILFFLGVYLILTIIK